MAETDQTDVVKRSRKSLIWVAAESGANALLLLVTMLVMARLVGPAAFGAASVAIGLIQLTNIFVEYLFHDAIILHEDIDDAILNGLFVIVQIIALCFLAISLAAALWAPVQIAQIAWLSFGAACSLPFSGMVGIWNARLRRSFHYRDVAKASICGRLAGAVLGVSAALYGLDAWSLVVQFTGSVAVNGLALSPAVDWRPTLRITRRIVGLLRFALPYALRNSIVAVRLQGFSIICAALLGVVDVGYINAAFRIINTPQTILSVTLANFMLPAFSRSRQSSTAIANDIQFNNRIALLTTLPLYAGLAVTAGELVPLVLGDSWSPSIPVVQLLALGAIVAAVRFPGSVLLRAHGVVKFSFYNALFQLVVTFGALLVFRPATPVGTVLCWIAPTLVPLAVTSSIVQRATEIPVASQLNGVFPILFSTCVMMTMVKLTDQFVPLDSHLSRLALEVAIGMASFPVPIFLLDKPTRSYLRQRLSF